jgi:peptide/nickel transport system ATP-binding protein
VHLLKVDRLKVYFRNQSGQAGHKRYQMDRAVDDVSFTILKGRNIGLVGESGCGKTTIARSVTGLQKIHDGSVFFMDQQLYPQNGNRKHLLSQMRLIFQNPEAALNPHMRIGDILDEACYVRTGQKNRITRKRDIVSILDRIHLDRSFLKAYPKDLSGGQKRRIMIARALFGKPALIIGDEPLSSLDIVIQNQIIALFEELQREYGFTLMMISHGLDVIKRLCQDIVVIYKGKILEKLSVEHLALNGKCHEYTRMLVKASQLESVKTMKPSVNNNAGIEEGCLFIAECPRYIQKGCPAICREKHPDLEMIENDHWIACHFAQEIAS